MISATHLHAMFIHFPIAFLLLAFVSEVIAAISKNLFLRQAAFYLLAAGTLGALAAWLTGNAAGNGLEEGSLKNAMELHEQAAVITLCLSIATLTLFLSIHHINSEKKWLKLLRFLMFIALIAGITRTGYLGGQLVYKHGAGVQLALPDLSQANTDEEK
jgi:uncharacterized membrane protein